MRQTLRDELRKMEDLKIIRKSSSPYSSPVIVVKKKDGSNRVCIGYRWLNKITTFDPQPMTPPADVFQGMEKDQYFSKLDLSKGYWQIPVRKEDIKVSKGDKIEVPNHTNTGIKKTNLVVVVVVIVEVVVKAAVMRKRRMTATAAERTYTRRRASIKGRWLKNGEKEKQEEQEKVLVKDQTNDDTMHPPPPRTHLTLNTLNKK
ncbi:zinc finger protein [Elysia marginata]|uniref:Zinc finger protein n=1 Tax=Elysia marginata TaxID=1093978 RepID=A0AAV4EQW4_9GAST|nr:zinc finger protein [Elysia marginata]